MLLLLLQFSWPLLTPDPAPWMRIHSHNILDSFVQRDTHGQPGNTHTHTPTLTQSQAKSLHISSHSLHSAAKRLKCHKCSCSRRGQWKLSKLLLLPSLLPAPYHSHSLHISLTLLTLSFLTSSPPLLSSSLFFFCSLSFSSPALWSVFFPCPASAQCTSIIQRQSPGSFWLIQSEQGSALMGSCCTCYRLQHTLETAGVGVEVGGGRNRQREQKRQPRRREDEKER